MPFFPPRQSNALWLVGAWHYSTHQARGRKTLSAGTTEDMDMEQPQSHTVPLPYNFVHHIEKSDSIFLETPTFFFLLPRKRKKVHNIFDVPCKGRAGPTTPHQRRLAHADNLTRLAVPRARQHCVYPQQAQLHMCKCFYKTIRDLLASQIQPFQFDLLLFFINSTYVSNCT